MPPRKLLLTLAEMLEAIVQAKSFTAGMTFEEFLDNDMAARAVERCLEIVSEASRRIPAEMRSQYGQIPWEDVADSGNILRHEYHRVDSRVIWDTVQIHLDPLALVLQAMRDAVIEDGADN